MMVQSLGMSVTMSVKSGSATVTKLSRFSLGSTSNGVESILKPYIHGRVQHDHASSHLNTINDFI